VASPSSGDEKKHEPAALDEDSHWMIGLEIRSSFNLLAHRQWMDRLNEGTILANVHRAKSSQRLSS
jgi:hypothetical protein